MSKWKVPLSLDGRRVFTIGGKGTGKTYAGAQVITDPNCPPNTVVAISGVVNHPSPMFVCRLQMNVGAYMDGILGPETLDKYLELYKAGAMSLAEFRRHLHEFERTGIPSPQLVEYARDLQRQDAQAAADAVERIAEEMNDIAHGR